MKKLMFLCCFVVLSFFCSQARASELIGGGATFPYPFYAKLFDVYYKQKAVKVNYQAIGSGGGIRQVMNKTVDFGGTDAFMTKKDMEKASSPIVHIPTCIGGDVVTYNIPGSPVLKLTPEVIVDMFLGKISKWNDSCIAAVNPEVKLPDMNIVVVHRSDGSGTTFIFTDYLSKVSPGWKEKVGAGKSVNWPTGLGAKGNAGVAGLVKQVPGSVGYVELIYAMSNSMPCAEIKNRAGLFVKPSIQSVSLAGDISLPMDTRITITDTEALNGYPLSSFTWMILYREQNYNKRTEQKAMALVDMLWWVLHDGQQFAEPLHYAPLPKEAVEKGEDILRSITFNGRKLIKK